MKKIILTLSFVAIILSLKAQMINTETSKVTFEVGNMRINTVEGSFGGMKGAVVFDAANLTNASFNVCIDPATVSTGIKKRDNHLRSEDFFDVEKHPEICFVSNGVEKKGTNFLAKGKLTIHGITKEVEIPFTHEGNILTGILKVKRLDYKVGVDTGTFMASNQIDVTIVCQLDS